MDGALSVGSVQPAFATLLELIDDATERGDARTARELLDNAAATAPDPTHRALVTVRAAFVPGSGSSTDHLTDLRAARATLQEAGLDWELPRTDGAVATLLLESGDPLGAATAFADAEGGAARLGDLGSARRSRLNRAAALTTAGRLRAALVLLVGLRTELDLTYTLDPHERGLLSALTASNAAAAHLAAGQLDAADDELGRATREYDALGLTDRAATVVFNAAFAASRADQPELAHARYRDAARRFDRAGDRSSSMAALRGVGATAATLGRADDSEAAFAQALAHFRTRGPRHEVLRTVIGLAAARARHDPQAALQLLVDVVTDADRTDPALVLEVVDAWHNRGALATQLDDTDQALKAFEEAERLAATADLGALVTRARMGAAIALDAAGHRDEALRTGLSARQTAEAAGVRGLALAHMQTNVAGFALRVGGNPAAAIEPALAAVTTVEQHRYSLTVAGHRQHVLEDRERTVYATAIAAARALGDDDTVAALIETTRAHGVPDRTDHDDPGLTTLAAGTPFPLAAPTAVATRPRSRVVGADGPPIMLRAAAQRIENRQPTWWLTSWVDRRAITVAAAGPDRTIVGEAPVDVDAYLALLACLGVVFPVDAEIAALGRGSPADVVGYRCASTPLLDDPELAARWADRLTRNQRDAVDDHDAVHLARTEGEAGLLWRLGRQLLPPALRQHLLYTHRQGQRVTLAVAPVSALGRVPWALLPLHDPTGAATEAPRVLDVADVVYAPPAAFLDGCPPPAETAGDVLCVVDPLGDLTQARVHAARADRLLGGAWLGDPDRLATPQRLVDELRAQPVRLLVVAAHHAELDADHPAEAGVVLDDDGRAEAVLTANYLRDAQVPGPATALVLGCESLGTASGAEWTGFALGLLGAGTRQVVGTLWPTLDDQATTTVERNLVDHVVINSPTGYRRFLNDQAARWRDNPDDPATRPYRWAAYGQIRAGQES